MPGGGAQDVTLVRAADLVVRDEDGTYFRVEERQLLLPQLPDTGRCPPRRRA